jgi:hypothetical protein
VQFYGENHAKSSGPVVTGTVFRPHPLQDRCVSCRVRVIGQLAGSKNAVP